MRKILFVLLVVNCCLRTTGQVNLQSGSAVFSLPMFNWQDNMSRLSDGVALFYNSAQGLKVDEVASNVGQGWNLMAAGAITRIQVGEPDDQKPRDGNFNDRSKYPPGYLYNPVDPNLGCPKELGNYPLFGSANQVYKQHNSIAADREQDYFSFQFNGRNGMFILGRNNDDKGIVLGDSKIKVWFDRNESIAQSLHSRTTIIAFHIQDENGLIYTFSQLGKTKVLRLYPTSPNNQFWYSSYNYNEGSVNYERGFDLIPLSENPFIISNWYLQQIRDPLTGRTINVNYITRNLNNFDGDDIRYCYGFSGSNGGNPYNGGYFVITHKISITETPTIASIHYPDGYSVTFNYDELHPRADLQGDCPLKSVHITYNGRVVSDYQFNTTYFLLNGYGTPTVAAERKNARLCLKSVTKIGVDGKEDEPPYIFDYYLGSNAPGDFVPPPFYYFKDVYGYYNGGKNNDLLQSSTGTIPFFGVEPFTIGFEKLKALCFFRSDDIQAENFDYRVTNPGFAKNGLLKSITNPSGGVLTYEYEQNKYTGPAAPSDAVAPNEGAGVHVSKILQTDGGSSFDGLKTQVTTYNYAGYNGAQSSLWGQYFPQTVIGTIYTYSPGGKHYSFPFSCKYDYTYPGILSKEEAQSIPTERISFMQIFSGVATVASLAYDVFMLIAASNPTGLILDMVMMIVRVIESCSDDYQQTGMNVVCANYIVAHRNAPPPQFSRVEVIQGDPSNNQGRTVNEFTSPSDYAVWDNNMQTLSSFHFTMRQNGASWAYGLPKKMTVLDATGIKVKQTENYYYWDNAQRSATTDMSCFCVPQHSVSINSSDWMNLSDPQNLHFVTGAAEYPVVVIRDKYSIYTGRVQLKDTYERTFRQGDDSRYTETLTHYDYNSNNYQVSRVATTQSNGDKVIKEIYYPEDYSAGGIQQALANHNIVNIPVATYTAVQKNGSSVVSYLGAAVTDFTYVATGDIRPSRTLAGRSTAPVTNFSFNPGNPFNYPGLVENGSFSYNAAGNMSVMKDEGGRLISNIYDYNDKHVVATIGNADLAVDHPAYSSFETQQLGGWSLTGNAIYANSAVTGVNSFTFSNNSLSGTLNSNKSYKLTFWATGAVNISAPATLVTSGPVINGFTYYEYEIKGGSSSVTISGNGNIDELRLYPTTARMRTVTYDPLIGKTAECDENNRITYYEYDNMGRLRFIKDENRIILKMYEYNFKK